MDGVVLDLLLEVSCKDGYLWPRPAHDISQEGDVAFGVLVDRRLVVEADSLLHRVIWPATHRNLDQKSESLAVIL